MRLPSFRAHAPAVVTVVSAIFATLISTQSFANTSSNCAECNSGVINQTLSTPGANNQGVVEFTLESLMGPAQGVSNQSVMFDDQMAKGPILPPQPNLWTPGTDLPFAFNSPDSNSDFVVPSGFWTSTFFSFTPYSEI